MFLLLLLFFSVKFFLCYFYVGNILQSFRRRTTYYTILIYYIRICYRYCSTCSAISKRVRRAFIICRYAPIEMSVVHGIPSIDMPYNTYIRVLNESKEKPNTHTCMNANRFFIKMLNK